MINIYTIVKKNIYTKFQQCVSDKTITSLSLKKILEIINTTIIYQKN